MITNERQYRISKAQLARFRQAVDAFDVEETAEKVGSRVLARAELDALKSEEQSLSEQIRGYEALKSGAVRVLKADKLEELPGILIRARIARGLSQRDLAKLLGLKEQQIQRYESEEYRSVSLRRLAEIARALHLNIQEVAELTPCGSTRAPRSLEALEWDKFPVKEMYRRGWFKDVGFTGSMGAAVADAPNLVRAYVQEAMPQRQTAFLRQRVRSGSQVDTYALWAWQCRVVLLARQQKALGAFSKDLITKEWLTALVHQSWREDGPLRARDMLREAGMPLVIEPRLQRTYLDGAAFLLPDGRPVIGMTLRYDRIDSFWFVLLHELTHAVRHLRKGKLEEIFDDMDAEPDDLEREADTLAGAALIPEADWEVALPRYLRTEKSVREFAAEQGIHPAIVAGRIRQEADNYTILTDLVGSARVRELFPEVDFAQ